MSYFKLKNKFWAGFNFDMLGGSPFSCHMSCFKLKNGVKGKNSLLGDIKKSYEVYYNEMFCTLHKKFRV